MSNQTTNKTTNTTNEAEELVTIELFKDNGKYKDPLLLAVNGERVLIERGVPVQVKRKFLWALEQSQLQDRNTARLIADEARAFSDASARVSRLFG